MLGTLHTAALKRAWQVLCSCQSHPNWALSRLWQLFLPAVSQHYCQNAVQKLFVLLALVQPLLWFQAPSWSLNFSVLTVKWHLPGDEKSAVHNWCLYSNLCLCGFFHIVCPDCMLGRSTGHTSSSPLATPLPPYKLTLVSLLTRVCVDVALLILNRCLVNCTKRVCSIL